VVCSPELGAIVPFDDQMALTAALDQSLLRRWDVYAIRAYAEENSWDNRVEVLVSLFKRMVREWT